MLHNLIPETRERLKSQKGKIVPAISIGCLGAFFVFIPALVSDLTTPAGISIVVVSYAVMLFFVTAFKIVSGYLGIGQTLFNDYTNYPSFVHWGIIIVSILSVLILSAFKVIVALKDTEHSYIKWLNKLIQNRLRL